VEEKGKTAKGLDHLKKARSHRHKVKTCRDRWKKQKMGGETQTRALMFHPEIKKEKHVVKQKPNTM